MPSTRAKLSATATWNEITDIITEGHFGSADALLQIIRRAPSPLDIIFDLDDMNMRGRQIWHAWHDVCGQDMAAFVQRVTDRDSALVDGVNALTPGEPERAVRQGGSFRPKPRTCLMGSG
jgi:hypothetical protein